MIRAYKRQTILVLLFTLVLVACGVTQTAVDPVQLNPIEFQIFADAFFKDQMATLHIPGLSFILVQDGKVILTKGYGVANLESGKSIDPLSSVIGIGSVSKLFVATAVMQLYESGKVDLQTDINDYLTTFQVADSYPEPVTLAQLLTHMAGFEDPPYHHNPDPEQGQPLSKYLSEKIPDRTQPPGKTFLYSNLGYALAALVVQEVTATPFNQYVNQQIFEPLGMDQSTYLIAPPLPENMVTGYLYQDGVQVPQPLDYDSDYPAGSILSTAEDMAHFIIAHLGNGCYLGSCILQPDTLAEMHQRQGRTPNKGQNVAFGFVEGVTGNVRMIGHSGATRGFGSSLNILPKHNIGYFFSFNAECHQTTACQIIPEFRQQFIEYFIK